MADNSGKSSMFFYYISAILGISIDFVGVLELFLLTSRRDRVTLEFSQGVSEASRKPGFPLDCFFMAKRRRLLTVAFGYKRRKEL
jgi:hypothetical protein